LAAPTEIVDVVDRLQTRGESIHCLPAWSSALVDLAVFHDHEQPCARLKAGHEIGEWRARGFFQTFGHDERQVPRDLEALEPLPAPGPFTLIGKGDDSAA
jgi:hypothetical protein